MFDYTVDLLIFGISNKKNINVRELSKKNLSVILVKRDKEPFKDMLVLPGGYVNNNETSEEAAKRILEKETGLKDINLYLSGINDGVKRDPRNRTISVSYIALVDVERINKKLKEKYGNNEIKKSYEKELADMGDALAEKDIAIANKEEVIANKDDEIRRLRDKLKENGLE